MLRKSASAALEQSENCEHQVEDLTCEMLCLYLYNCLEDPTYDLSHMAFTTVRSLRLQWKDCTCLGSYHTFH